MLVKLKSLHLIVLSILITMTLIACSESKTSSIQNSTGGTTNQTNTQNPSNNPKEKSQSLSKEELDLVGFWHAMPNVAAGYAERYLFYKDRTYKFLPSSMGTVSETGIKSGKWSIKDNKLYLLEDKKSESKVVEIGPVENVSENPAYKFKVKIGNQYYWKFSDNPDFLEINSKSNDNLPPGSTTLNMPIPLKENDFAITDGINKISLYMAFGDLKLDKTEKKVENRYVGETLSGDYVYKSYMHEYDVFDLYVSNTNYNLKGRNFDDRYISQITLKGKSDFKTPRGITVGSTMKEVLSAYGQTAVKSVNGNDFIEYVFDDMGLNIYFDSNQTVSNIVINIIVKQ